MFMRKRILKWKRDRAVARLSRNCQQLDWVQVSFQEYKNRVPDGERNLLRLIEFQQEIERLARKIEDDKNFIRTTA